MKVNPVFFFLFLAIAVLAGYGFFSWNSGETLQLLITIGAGLTVFITIGSTIAIKSAGGRGSIGNIRALSIVFLIIFAVSNVIFSLITLITPTAYIVTNGILLIVYILIVYSISRALN
jgi:hypothetical protein